MKKDSKLPFVLTLLIIFHVSVITAVVLLLVNYKFVILPQRELDRHSWRINELSRYLDRMYDVDMIYVGYMKAEPSDYEPSYSSGDRPDGYIYYFYPAEHPEHLFTAYSVTTDKILPGGRIQYSNLFRQLKRYTEAECSYAVQNAPEEDIGSYVSDYQLDLAILYKKYGIEYKPEDLTFKITVERDGVKEEMVFPVNQ